MMTKRNLLLLLAGAIVFSLAAGGAIGLYAQSQLNNNIIRQMHLFNEAFQQVMTRYVTAPNPQKLIYGAIKGMLGTLDPHSQFLEPSALRELRSSTQGSFGGIGIQIGIRDNALTVIAPMPGTPASRLGLQAGDRIATIEGKTTKGITTDQAVSKLRGDPGTKVTIAIEREGADEPLEYTITRELIEIPSVLYAGMVRPGVGYIWLTNFSEKADGDIRREIAGLEGRGMKQLILDLRNNPGGLLNEAVDVSSAFLDKGSMVVFTKGRLPDASREYKVSGNPLFGPKKGSMVVLVNQGSASASEIVAGAMQDWDRALILGETSFGKGSVQTIYPLGDSIAVKLTTAKYYTPSGRCIHRDNSAWQSGEADSLEEDSTAAKEMFTTVGGLKRTVYGGGGIAPDVKVVMPRLTKLEVELTRKSLYFKFAIRYLAAHKELNEAVEVTPAMLDDFKALMAEEKISCTDEEWFKSENYIRRTIKGEILVKRSGEKAMLAFYLESDPQVQKALELLEKNKDLTKLLRSQQEK